MRIKINSLGAENLCCNLLNDSGLFDCQPYQEGPNKFDKTDLNCSLKDNPQKEFRIQVKSRKIKQNGNSIIFLKGIKKHDIDDMSSRNIPYLIVFFNSNGKFTNIDSNPAYGLLLSELKEQLNQSYKNWKLYKKNSTFNVFFLKKNNLSIEYMKKIKTSISNFHEIIHEFKENQFGNKKLGLNYLSPSEFNYLMILNDNPLIKKAFYQINNDYQERTILHELFQERKYDNQHDKRMSFKMFPQHIKLLRTEFENTEITTYFQNFGFAIFKGEFDYLYKFLQINRKINKKNINKINYTLLKRIVNKIHYPIDVILLSHELYVDFLMDSKKECSYLEHFFIWDLGIKKIRIEFMFNDRSHNKIILLNKNSICHIYKDAYQTTDLRNINYAMPYTIRDKRMDFRFYLDKIDNEELVGLIFRTISGFKIINPSNITLIKYNKYIRTNTK